MKWMTHLQSVFDESASQEQLKSEQAQSAMIDIVLNRRDPTRFEYVTKGGKHVAVWFVGTGQLCDDYNFDKFEADLDSGLWPLERGSAKHDVLDSQCGQLATILESHVRVNEQWFSSSGTKVDKATGDRFQQLIDKLPLNKVSR